MPFNIHNIVKQVAKQIGIASAPQDIFYLSLSQTNKSGEVTVFNQLHIGTTNISQSSISPLYKDPILKQILGKSSSVATVFEVAKPSKNNLYNASVETVYRTPKGNIGISHAPVLQKFPKFYGLPHNHIEIAPIVFGTGVYLNKQGYVCIATGSDTTKLIMVFLINYKYCFGT
jgi:hypothetical protein